MLQKCELNSLQHAFYCLGSRGSHDSLTLTQVQIGSHSFTFDHVYGDGGSPSSSMFEECIVPLVDGLFQGYNATVLAYGQVVPILHVLCSKFEQDIIYLSINFGCTYVPQTGSGKTYTMGTGYSDNCRTGIIPQVMDALFNKIETLKHQTEFQLHVSFIEVHPYINVKDLNIISMLEPMRKLSSCQLIYVKISFPQIPFM